MGEPFSGLRERKRRQTEQEILSNAISQFREQGIRGARLADIARSSEVAPATLFNYFPTKSALAEAWVRGELRDSLQRVSTDLEKRGLRTAMRGLCAQISKFAFEHEDRSVRLEAWAEAGRVRLRSFEKNDPLVLALSRDQEGDRLRGDIGALSLAEILMDTIEGGLIAGLKREMTESDLARLLRSRVDLVLDGARKRNERVTAPVRGLAKTTSSETTSVSPRLGEIPRTV